MAELATLLCGDYHTYGEVGDILGQLGITIDDFSLRCYKFIAGQNNEDLMTFGAYSARIILETACTIFIGRLDSYRLLLIKRYQERPEYDIAIRHKISIQWTGDIIAPEKPPGWEKLSSKNIARSLLVDDYTGELYWKTGFLNLLDEIQNETDSEWLEGLKILESRSLPGYLRTEAERLYSSLSKGIHREFLVPLPARYDEVTVTALIRDTISLVSKMGLIINCIPTTLGNLPKERMLDCVKIIEQNCGV